MPSEDMTFCAFDCDNKKCIRNNKNIKSFNIPHSYSYFTECGYRKKWEKKQMSMQSGRPTRFYSNKQEKHIAKAVNGKQVANSGATPFQKGDIKTDHWLFEAKTKMNVARSFSIKREWLDKNKEEMFAMGKSYCALVFDFGDGNNYYVLDEKTFLQMKEKFDSER